MTLTPNDLLAIMESIAIVDDRIRTLVLNSSREDVVRSLNNAALNLGNELLEDLESTNACLSEIDKHLMEHEHSPESVCWRYRCAALEIKRILEYKLTLIDRLVAALLHYAHPENVN